MVPQSLASAAPPSVAFDPLAPAPPIEASVLDPPAPPLPLVVVPA